MRIVNLLPKGPLDYQLVDRLQHHIHDKVATEQWPDTIIAVEHKDAYTAGRRTQEGDVRNPDIPVYPVDRGGRITYHGPGQLVLYPIFVVAQPVDVVRYVRTLEASVITALAQYYGLDTKAVEGRSGVWLAASNEDDGLGNDDAGAHSDAGEGSDADADKMDAEKAGDGLGNGGKNAEIGRPERKICAMGVKFARQTTMHGIALNVSTDLAKFGEIIPCGITDAGVTSLVAEGVDVGGKDALAQVASNLIPQLIEDLEPLRPLERLGSIETLSSTQIDQLLEAAEAAK